MVIRETNRNYHSDFSLWFFFSFQIFKSNIYLPNCDLWSHHFSFEIFPDSDWRLPKKMIKKYKKLCEKKKTAGGQCNTFDV